MRVLLPSEIRSLRIRLGLTQSELAERVGVTQAYISKIESGTADPRISTLEEISEALEEVAPEDRIKAGQVMNRPIISVAPKDKVKKVIELMVTHDISQIPVLQRRRQVGSISEDTLIRRISAGEDISDLVDLTVDDIMEDPFPTIGDGADVNSLSPILEHEPAVLVLDKGKPRGIITKADLLRIC